MQRILSLPIEFLRSGEARSKHDNKGGAWENSIGLNPFLESDAYRFLLATTAAPTRIDATDITDIPIAFARDPRASTGDFGYILGSSGRFYSLRAEATDANVIRPGASVLTVLSNPTGGMIGLTDSGGNTYMFIALNQDLVRWNLDTGDSAAHWNVGNNGLVAHYRHPMHRLFDSVYFGNGYYLGRIPLDAVHNQATALSNVSFQLLNVGNSREKIDAIGDDGRYVIIASSLDTSTSLDDTAEARLIWYTGEGSNWAWEVTIKGERHIRAIVRNALGVFAVGEQNIYQIGFGLIPKPLRIFAAEDAIASNDAYDSSSGRRVNQAAPYGSSIIFGKRGAVFGQRDPSERVTFSHPLQGHTDNISMIVPDFERNAIIVGTEDSKLWRYAMGTAGNTTNDYRTRWLDLDGEHNIEAIEINLPQGIGASDVTTITVEVPSGETAAIVLSQAAVEAEDRNYAAITFPNGIRGSRVRLTVEPTAGTPALGSIYLYGQPIAR